MSWFKKLIGQLIALCILGVGGLFAYENPQIVTLNLGPAGPVELPAWVFAFSALCSGFMIAVLLGQISRIKAHNALRKIEKSLQA